MQGEIRIELSWPAKELSPNHRSRSHWGRTRKLKEAREEAFWATKYALGKARFSHDGARVVPLRQIAHPPGNYHYDRDGIDARLKPHRDGIADALGLDDKHFHPLGIEWADPVPNGRVVIIIGESMAVAA